MRFGWQKIWALFLGVGLVGLLAACRDSTFESTFDPRVVKDAFASWMFGNSIDYVYDSGLIQVSGNKASLRPVGFTDFSTGTHTGTAYSAGRLKLDSATSGDTALAASWTPKYSSLLGYWKMDNNWDNALGTGNNGNGLGATFSTSAKVGSHAGNFTSSGHAVNFGDLTGLNGVSKFSASIWFNPASLSDTRKVFGKRLDGEKRIELGLSSASAGSNNDLNIVLSNNGANVTFGYTTEDLIKVGEWQHALFTYDGTKATNAEKLVFYFNGVKRNLTFDGTIPAVTDATAGVDLRAGESVSTNGAVIGLQDEFAIWSETLSAGEVALIYERQKHKFSGFYDSAVMDLGAAGAWDGLQATSPLPFFKELPAAAGSETSANYSEASSGLLSGLIAYWDFNETALNSVGGSDFRDRAGASHLNETNGALPNVDGVMRRGVSLEGANDYLSAPIDLSAYNKITVSFWMQLLAKSGTPIPLEFTPNFNTGNGGFILIPLETAGAFNGYASAGWKGNTGYNVKGFDTNLLQTGKYQHFTLVIDSSQTAANEVKIYIDGKEITNTFQTTSTSRENTSNFANSTLYLGARGGASLYAQARFDELAIWNRPLSANEILQLYRRGANRQKYQVRSCNDSACVGEDWLGPDGSAATYFSELHNNDALNGSGSPAGAAKNTALDLSFANFPADARPANNRYFQYRVLMQSEDENSLCGGVACGPELNSLSFPPTGRYFNGAATISNRTGVSYTSLQNIAFASGGACTPKYQLSRDGSNYYYWNGTGWTAAADSVAQASLAADISANISRFTVGGNFFFRAYLPSNGAQACELHSVNLNFRN